MASLVRGNNKRGYGLYLHLRFSPYLVLKLHATEDLLQSLAFSDLYALPHFLDCVFAISPTNDFPSSFFVASQRASLSSRGRSLHSRPDSRANTSIARKRRENFAFAFLSAISGSTCRKRERFIAAN